MGGGEGFEIVLNMGKEQSTTSLGFTTRLKGACKTLCTILIGITQGKKKNIYFFLKGK